MKLFLVLMLVLFALMSVSWGKEVDTYQTGNPAKPSKVESEDEFSKEIASRLKAVLAQLDQEGIAKGKSIWLVIPMSHLKFSAIIEPEFKAPGLTKLEILDIIYIIEDRSDWIAQKYGHIVLKVKSEFGVSSIKFSDWPKKNENGVDTIINSFYSDYPASRWGKKAIKAIKNGNIYIGMTKAQVMASIGRAFEINRSVGKWGVHEQWDYDGMYLYFENNLLKSWQD